MTRSFVDCVNDTVQSNNNRPNRDVTCSNFLAAGTSGTTRYKGLDETGIMGSFCARHEFPLKMVDMTYGERYDIILFTYALLFQGSAIRIHYWRISSLLMVQM